MTGDTMQIPGTREWVWTFFPWGLQFTVVAVGSLATGQFTLAAVMLAADIGYSAFMLHIRRLNRQTFLRVSGDRLCVVSRDGDLDIDFKDISHIDWLPGSGSPMWTSTSTPPHVKITLRSGEAVQVELFFAKFWTQMRAISALRKAMAPVVVRG